MIVRFISVKIISVQGQYLPSTRSQPARTRTTTKYDLSSAQEHVLDIGPPPVLLTIKETLIDSLFISIFTFLVPLLAMAMIGGTPLLVKAAGPVFIVWTIACMIVFGPRGARHSHQRKQMKLHVDAVRGTQDNYEIVLAKNWAKWKARLTVAGL